jgi:hypothetical protein
VARGQFVPVPRLDNGPCADAAHDANGALAQEVGHFTRLIGTGGEDARRRHGATAVLPQQGVLTPAQQRTIVKLVKRLGPFLGLCYFVAYLDRVNVGFAALTMSR